MQIEVIIYIYLIVCVCMILMNCVVIFYRAGSSRRVKKRAAHMVLLLERHFDRPADEAKKKQFLIWLDRHLRQLSYLMAFHQAIDKQSVQHPIEVQKFLKECLLVFRKLAVWYGHRNNMKSAYFTWIMAQYPIYQGSERDAIIDEMEKMIVSESAYCRENALKALYSFGNAENIYGALKAIDENAIFHHDKLLVDGMRTFTGEKKALAALLWQHYGEFHNSLRMVILQFLRYVCPDYGSEILMLLSDNGEDLEIRIHCVRYLWGNPYKPSGSYLRRMMWEEAQYAWELCAIAASALRAYPGSETVAALKQGLYSTHWYVRFNAADSLNALKVNYLELASIYHGQDRYAREMLQYHEAQRYIKEGTGQ